jgi:hypothetical protein
MSRLVLIALLFACERTDLTPEQRCKVRYAEYEARSGDAWRDDALAAGIERSTAELVVTKTGDSLPTREELSRIKAIHAAGGGPSMAWQAAYVAIDRAIAACGEGAGRPPK